MARSRYVTMDALHGLIKSAGGIRAFSRKLGYKSHSYTLRIASGTETPSFGFLRRVRQQFGVILDPRDFEAKEARA